MPAPFGWEIEYGYARINGVLKSIELNRVPKKRQHDFDGDASGICQRCGLRVDDQASHGAWQQKLSSPDGT